MHMCVWIWSLLWTYSEPNSLSVMCWNIKVEKRKHLSQWILLACSQLLYRHIQNKWNYIYNSWLKEKERNKTDIFNDDSVEVCPKSPDVTYGVKTGAVAELTWSPWKPCALPMAWRCFCMQWTRIQVWEQLGTTHQRPWLRFPTDTSETL